MNKRFLVVVAALSLIFLLGKYLTSPKSNSQNNPIEYSNHDSVDLNSDSSKQSLQERIEMKKRAFLAKHQTSLEPSAQPKLPTDPVFDNCQQIEAWNTFLERGLKKKLPLAQQLEQYRLKHGIPIQIGWTVDFENYDTSAMC